VTKMVSGADCLRIAAGSNTQSPHRERASNLTGAYLVNHLNEGKQMSAGHGLAGAPSSE